MKFDRFDYFIWTILACLVIGIASLVIQGDASGPRLLAFSPAQGEMAASLAQVRLVFDRPMSVESLEAHWEIEPGVAGTFTLEGNQVIFTPQEAYPDDEPVRIRVRAGAKAVSGKALTDDIILTFHIRAPTVVYLGDPQNERELWQVSIHEPEPLRLTDSGGRIFDYDVDWHSGRIIYSAVNVEGGIDLWLLELGEADPLLPANLLLDCGIERCRSPVWSPDGNRIAFSRERATLGADRPLTAARIWMIDLDSLESAPLFEDQQILGSDPRWGRPDQIAFYDFATRQIRLVNLSDGLEINLPSQLGAMGSWSPDGAYFAYHDFTPRSDPSPDRQAYRSLFMADLLHANIITVFDGDKTKIDYGTPIWSPTGDWLAIAVTTEESKPGRELWRIPPDGLYANVIANEPSYVYTDYRWDIQSKRLVFQRTKLGQANVKPEIMVWEQDSGQVRLLVEDGIMPRWWP